MVLFVLHKLILQTRLRSHPVGLNVWFLVRPFVYFHSSCVRTAKALARLRGCAGSPEPSLVAYVISTIISWAGSNTVEPSHEKKKTLESWEWRSFKCACDATQKPQRCGSLSDAPYIMWANSKGSARLGRCAGLPKPLLVAYTLSTLFTLAGSIHEGVQIWSNHMSHLITKPTKLSVCPAKTRMPKLIWFFTARKGHFVGFVMRWLKVSLLQFTANKFEALPSIVWISSNEFNKFNNTGARMQDSIYHMTLKWHFIALKVSVTKLFILGCFSLLKNKNLIKPKWHLYNLRYILQYRLNSGE